MRGVVMRISLENIEPCEFSLWGARTKRGLDVLAIVDGELVPFRLGYATGGRFGRKGPWISVWHDGDCLVQGNFADDFDQSKAYISQIERDSPAGPTAKELEEIPADYDGDNFDIVWLRDEITGPRAGHCYAVKIRDDDYLGWLRHAVIRRRQQGRELRTLGSAPTGGAGRLNAADRPDVKRQIVERATRAAAVRKSVLKKTKPSPRRGQRIMRDAKRKVAIEQHAVALAIQHYEAAKWSVNDVGASESYDLLCRKRGKELHVEVKGTTGAGKKVSLTANEVAHARREYPRVALFAVTGIVVSTGAEPEASGGAPVVFDPWDLEPERLRPQAYDYTLPPV